MQVNNLFEQDEQITLESYLNKMGIDNINKYLKPPLTVLDNCYLYNNIQEGVQTLKYHILNDSRIAIIQDADMDGSCSCYMMYKALKLHGVTKVKPFIQNGKERGIQSESMRNQVLEWQPELIIIPDAGTNSAPWENEFIDNGIDILVVDHHNADKDVCQHAIVINNTMNTLETNIKLSGTGVTFKVLQALDYEMGTKYSNQFIDLVGLSIISDGMDVRTYENRWFVKYILEDKEHIKNPFMYALFNKFLGDTYTQRDISFRIVPLINSVIRCGTTEDKQQLFLAFDGKKIDETIEMCTHYHQEQVQKRDKFIEHHQEEINEQADSNITIIDAKDIPQNFSGLIAGKISGDTNKPCIVGKATDGELGGSFRGYISIDTMRELPSVTFAQGHDMGAYGIRLKTQNLDDFRAEIDKMDISIDKEVIASYSANKLQMGLFNEFVGHEDLWGKELDKPMFHVYNIRVNSKDIKVIGKKADTIKLSLDGYDVMFFKLTEEKKAMFHLNENVELNINIVGSVNINEYYNKRTNQIIVDDFEIKVIENSFEDLM